MIRTVDHAFQERVVRIGYVSTHQTLGCTSASTFRLASYSPERFCETVGNNLICLLNTLRFNVDHRILFFRISSDFIPFASHPVCDVDWRERFKTPLSRAGHFIRRSGIRISMHPGQFTLLNSLNEATVENSIRELAYHADLLDALELDSSHKIQIHVGGVYGDKAASLERFAHRFPRLPENVRRRLVVENDDRLYTVCDCRWLYERIGTPIVFDNLHHTLNNTGDSLQDAFAAAHATWSLADGVPITDYSEQAAGKRVGSHTDQIDIPAFLSYLRMLDGFDFDVMLEIKDKQASALKAVGAVHQTTTFASQLL